MAKRSGRKRKYSRDAGREVKNEMHRYKRGQLALVAEASDHQPVEKFKASPQLTVHLAAGDPVAISDARP
jgi:hypothetical protein